MVTVVESATVAATATVDDSSTVDASATVVKATTVDKIPADRIAILNQAKPPRELASAWRALGSGRSVEAARVQWVGIAQHSMNGGQERVYESIWRSKGDYRFHVEAIDRHVRRFSAGYDVLAKVCRLAPRNVQNVIPILIQKRILHSYKNHDSTTRKGTTYDIFSYEEILRRQRAAGLCYIAKNGPAVDFVVPDGWTVAESTTVVETSTVADSSRVVETSTGTIAESSRRTVVETSTPLDKSTLIRQSTTTAPSELLGCLETLMQGMDDGAAGRIWESCREVAPDVTPKEILFFFEQRLTAVLRNRRVENPTGLMIASVHEWLTPRKLQERREGLARAEAGRREAEQEAAESVARLQEELRKVGSR